MATIEELEQKIQRLERQMLEEAAKTAEVLEKSEEALDFATHSYKVDHYGIIWVLDTEQQGYRKTKMRVMTPEIADEAVTTEKMVDGAVTEGKLAPEAVTENKIAPKSVTENKIGAGAVTESKIEEEAVTEEKIGAGAVTEGKIGTGAVTESKIDEEAVTEDKIGTGAVTSGKIGAGAVTEDKLGDEAVTEGKIGAGAVTESKIGEEAVTAGKIGAGAVTESKIGEEAVTTGKIGTGAVTEGKIGTGAVTEDKLAPQAVTTDKLAPEVISELENITDVVPTAGSVKPMQSGGVLLHGSALDISELYATENPHTPAKYESLSAALAALAAKSSTYKNGGMSIKFILDSALYSVVKTEGLETEPTGTELSEDPDIASGTYTPSQLSDFSTLPTTLNSSLTYYMEVAGDTTTYTTWVITCVHTSDNKYVQYRLMANEWSTTTTDWQGVDAELTVGSHNLVESGMVYDADVEILSKIGTSESVTNKIYSIKRDGSSFGVNNGYIHGVIAVSEGFEYILSNRISQESTFGNEAVYAFVTTDASSSGGEIPYVTGTSLYTIPYGKSIVVTIPEGCTHIIADDGIFENDKRAIVDFVKIDISEKANNAVPKLIGKNLLDLNADGVSRGKAIQSVHNIIGNNEYTDISDYIPVEPGTAYHASANGDVVISGQYMSFYDADKNFISGMQIALDFTTPSLAGGASADCAFVRITCAKSLSYKMINKGSERGVYEEYSIIGGYPDKNNERIRTINSDIASLQGRMSVAESGISDLNNNVYEYIPDENLTTLVASTDKTAIGYYYYSSSKRQLTTNGTDVSSNGLYISCYVDIGEGIKIAAYTPSAEDGAAYCLYDANKVCIGYYRGESSGGTGTLQVLKKDYPNAKYIRWSQSNTTFTCYKIVKVSALDIVEDDLLPRIALIENAVHFVKDSASVATADSIADGGSLTLSSYPNAARKGDNISFTAKITSFDKIKIGKGCDTVYLHCWIEIDDTNVKVYRYKSTESGGNPTLEATEAHGLTIASMINVNIVFDGTIKLNLQSSDGTYKHEFELEGTAKYYNQRGNIKVVSDGSVLTDASLSATNTDFKCPIWVFGASYTNVSDNQMIGALKNLGYFGFYLHGYPGSESSPAFSSLQKALTFGTPQLLVWSIMSNDASDSTWQNYAGQVASLCSEKKIELIFVNYPDMREKEFSTRRQWVINGGYRYIDLPRAVQESSYVYDTDFWYSGMMRSDGVHPTILGADAMAMEILRDLPEIMQYAKD